VKTRWLVTALTALAGAAPALAAHAPAPARAHASAPAAASQGAAAGDTLAHRMLAAGTDSIQPDRLRLAQAVVEQSRGNVRGMIENLEAIDYASTPAYTEADRAAFLLGHAYLQAGRRADFLALAEQVSHWSRPSVFTDWIAYQRLATLSEEAGRPASKTRPGTPAARDSSESDAGAGAAAATQGGEAATALAASLWIRSGHPDEALKLLGGASAPPDASPATLCMRAAALQQLGRDDGPELNALAAADTTSALGRDLAGLARIQLATRAGSRGDDARALLAGVPQGSRYRSRAQQMLGLMALEAGDRESGERLLTGALAGDSTGSDWREVAMALAGQDLDQAHWDDAARRYRGIDEDWSHQRDSLESALHAGSFDALWQAWKSQPALEGALVVDELPSRILSDQLAKDSADLSRRPATAEPPLSVGTAPSAPLPAPPPADWERVMASERALADARGELQARRWDLDRERDRLAEQRRYLGTGSTELSAQTARLLAVAGILSSLGTTLDSLDARLRAVRDQERERVARRAAAIHEETQRNLAWARGMRQLYVDTPDSRRALAHPDGYAAPDSVLDRETALALAAQGAADSLATRTPGLLQRSYLEAWRPGLIDREISVSQDAVQTLSRAHDIQKQVDSSVVLAWKSPRLDHLESQVAALEPAVDSLTAQDQTLHDQVARSTIERAVAALDDEREGIDYGLAAAAYGMSVHLSQADSTLNTPAVVQSQDGARADSASATADESEDSSSVAQRAEAIARLTRFLERHPNSPSRAEMRFRLADLDLIEARRVFREQMAAYMKEGPGRGKSLPVLSHDAALSLYRKILAEDPDFAHRDAVLFNAGMILADEGDPEAASFFKQLVTGHAASPYVQEAYLRMGDMAFNDRHFSDCVALYQSAAACSDPTLAVIALYKMGWAHFNEDRFDDAAHAFGAVLDRYQGPDRAAIRVDIEGESRTYLVFSLAGAGGAPAFAKYFDGLGRRPYERGLLVALSQHFRRYDQYPQAAEVDELFIRRYALDPDALAAAQRLIENYLRSNRPAEAEQTRLEMAANFAPGGAWANGQTDDSTRTAGSTFARSCWMSLAFEHHRRAREGGGTAEWRQALDLYHTVLAHWPNDPEVTALQLNAGEAATELGDYAGALGHYDAAAKSGVDSVATVALLQRVAVTDQWYESTRRGAAGSATGTGSDSLAQAVIAAGDALLAHRSSDPHAADIVWRQSQLALAHGWHDLAIQKLDQLATHYPEDKRAAVAASQKGDALFMDGKFELAGPAFEAALEIARRAGRDSLARHDEQAIPVAYFRAAEAAVSGDSTDYTKHAELFQRVATRWPNYEYAHLAQYRAGLSYLKAGRTRDAVDAMQALVDHFPKSEYVRDAHLQIARTWEAAGDREKAADAYLAFARDFPADSSAKPAILQAGDLLAAAGLTERSDQVRSDFVKHHPEEVESNMEIMEDMAKRELAAVGPGHPLSALLPPAPRPRAKGAAVAAPVAAAPASHLAAYLALAAKHPKLASRSVVAEVRFLEAEESRPAFEAARLAQPLPKSLRAKQKLLDSLVARYRRTTQVGVPEWSHAAAFRIGEALVGFGESLEQSERPADLKGEDLRGYEDVLLEQAQAFYEKGEGVWSELLKQAGKDGGSDTWIAQARSALWPRLAKRFFFRPEVDFPLVAASASDHAHDESAESSAGDSTSQKSGRGHVHSNQDAGQP
jgi:tetratricopeptide (TPR) repeat protein